MTDKKDKRHHIESMLMRESLIDKGVIASTENKANVVRMLPDCHVVKIGASSIIDQGREVTIPLIDKVAEMLDKDYRIVFGTGGGARSRHIFSVGIDLGLPTGTLAQLAIADALGNAHILGTLLAPYGVVAIPPEIFGHLLPFFMNAVPGVVYNGDPPYALWEHPPSIGRIPPHRSDAGNYLVGECFGCRTVTLIKDVDGLYDEDPKKNPNANFIPKISTAELRERKFETLPFDRVLIDLLDVAKLVTKVQIINGHKPDLVEAALRDEHVGTIVYAE